MDAVSARLADSGEGASRDRTRMRRRHRSMWTSPRSRVRVRDAHSLLNGSSANSETRFVSMLATALASLLLLAA